MGPNSVPLATMLAMLRSPACQEVFIRSLSNPVRIVRHYNSWECLERSLSSRQAGGLVPFASARKAERYLNSHENTTIDDRTSFTYSAGDWTQLDSSGVNGSAANQSIPPAYTNMSQFFGSSISVTTTLGASANLEFRGEFSSRTSTSVFDGGAAEAIYVFGLSGPDCGGAQVLLDGALTQTLNLTVSGAARGW